MRRLTKEASRQRDSSRTWREESSDMLGLRTGQTLHSAQSVLTDNSSGHNSPRRKTNKLIVFYFAEIRYNYHLQNNCSPTQENVGTSDQIKCEFVVGRLHSIYNYL